ncbi:PAAR domain-containing protein [Burkholderia sp. lig30]|uniref:PAAR domain-containing protein n=1 Tax=Burkholderia sp. lig30 TaxID=1192124 RepID=UPI0005725F58|nr:PAAR domain-containing protein [Burkholderia sp. lig30]
MKTPIRQDDELEHGGHVTGGSPTTQFMGRPLARKGDAAICDLHGETMIDEGDASFPDQDGKPVAMHHHRCACGCRLIASLQNVHIG